MSASAVIGVVGDDRSDEYRRPAMYRFLVRPRWLAFTAVVVAAVVTMINLSIWQFHRLQERQAFNALVTSRSAAAPEAPQAGWLGPSADPTTAEWRNVQLRGRYVASGSQAVPAVGGYQIVTPFHLDDGTDVLVNRGILPATDQTPPPPADEIEIVGRVRRVPTGVRKAIGIGGTYVEAVASTPPDAPNLEPIAVPALDDGPHLSYAIQWAIFSACAAAGWALAVRSSARKAAGERSPRARRQAAVPWTDDPPGR